MLQQKKTDSLLKRKRVKKNNFLRAKIRTSNLQTALAEHKKGEANNHPIFGFSESKAKRDLRTRLRNFNSRGTGFLKDGLTISTASSKTTKHRYANLDDSFDNGKVIIEAVRTEVSEYNDDYSCSELGDSLGDIDSENAAAPPISRSCPLSEQPLPEQIMASFLEEAGLLKYVVKFLEEGFTSMDILVDVQIKHLTEMGVPRGFQIKLLKKLKNYREERGNSEQSILGDGEEEGISEEILDQNNDINYYSQNNGLNEVHYHENGSGTNENDDSVDKEDYQEEEESNNIEEFDRVHDLHTLNKNNEKQRPVMVSSTSQATQDREIIIQGTTSSKLRDACFTCFKIISGSGPVCSDFAGDRNFCENKCLKLFLLKHSTRCRGKECPIGMIIKQEGLYHEGSWYCSDKCVLSSEILPVISENDILVQDSSKSYNKEGEEDYLGDDDEEIDLNFDDF